MKKHIIDLVTEYVRDCNEGLWRDPVVGFADARNELPFKKDSRYWIAISYFIPYTSAANGMNRTEVTASEAWIDAYGKTELLLKDIDRMLAFEIKEIGYESERVVSEDHRKQAAYAAGIGTVGLNNHLITKKGCSGRIGCLLTSLKVIPDEPMKEDLCLYKKSGVCGICVKNCAANALMPTGYDSDACRKFCSENARRLGLTDEDPDLVCAKCISFSPCAYRK